VPERRPSCAVERLSLAPAEQWTLHDVLADRLRRDRGGDPADERTAYHRRQAFETLDDGGRRFTRPELEAMQRTLARAHHTRRWEVERPRLEALLRQISSALD